MGMSVAFHLNQSEIVSFEGYATTGSHRNNKPYVVLNVNAELGIANQEVSFFMNMENIQAMKKELAKAERQLKKLQEQQQEI